MTPEIVVGSCNPVKVEAVRLAGKEIFGEVQCSGVSASSDVPDQPWGDQQTTLGARNRAKHAFEMHKAVRGKEPSFAVGLEGGVRYTEERELECFAWCAVYDGVRYGTARSSSFNLPKAISDLVDEGMELGDADDAVFKSQNAKQGEGTIGHLTKGLISRTQYYTPIVILGFVPFQWPDLYP